MEAHIKATSEMQNLMVQEPTLKPTEVSILENMKMEWLMEGESISLTMGTNMLEISPMTTTVVLEFAIGKMETGMRVNGTMVTLRDMGSTFMPMETSTWDSMSRENQKGMAFSNG